MYYTSKLSSLETLIEKIKLTLIGKIFDFSNFFCGESRENGMNPLGAGITAYQFYLWLFLLLVCLKTGAVAFWLPQFEQ